MADEMGTATVQNDAELKKSIKSGMGLVVFAVVMTVIALSSIGFIIYSKVTEEKRIDNAISERCLTPASAVEGVPVAGNPDGAGTPAAMNCVNSDDANAASVNTAEYIYIADWGVKVKKPTDYYMYYRVIPDTGSFPGAKLELSASHKEAQQWANYGNFDNGGRLLQIVRTSDQNAFDGVGSGPALIGQIGDYYYWYYTPQACSSSEQQYCQQENDIFNAIKPAFADINNWSAI